MAQDLLEGAGEVEWAGEAVQRGHLAYRVVAPGQQDGGPPQTCPPDGFGRPVPQRCFEQTAEMFRRQAGMGS